MAPPKGHAPYPGCETGGVARKYDRDLLADDLIEWVKDSDNWTIKKWRIKHMITLEMVQDLRESSDKFRQAYAYAMDVIANRREEMNHTDEMKDSLYGKHLKVYDKDVVGTDFSYDDYVKDKELERKKALLREEIKLRAEHGLVDPLHESALQSALDLIASLQSQLSARRTSAIKSKDETKS